MAKKGITVKHISSDPVDPEVAKIMGPLPVDAEPKLSANTDKPIAITDESIDEQAVELDTAQSDIDLGADSLNIVESPGPPPAAEATEAADEQTNSASEPEDPLLDTEIDPAREPINQEAEINAAQPDYEEPTKEDEVAAESDLAIKEPIESEPIDTEKTDDTAFIEPEISETTPENTDTDAAVKDIISTESDEILKAEDEKSAHFALPPEKPKGVKAIFANWWHHRLLRNLTIIFLALVIITAMVVPASRYFILNSVGVKASTLFTVIDSKSGRPIKNVEVTIGSQSAKTDDNGKITINGLNLGKNTLTLKKRSFATVAQTITLGWGSNPYDSPFQLTPIGSQFNFTITDWLSGKPIAKAEISDGESVAITGEDGKATLTIEPTDNDIKLTAKAEFYRQENIDITATEKSTKSLALVPGLPDIFVSKRSGKYDLYKKDADGKNESVLLAATGSEQDSLSLLVSPNGATAAFVSTRDGKHNKDGFLLSNLYMVNITAKTVTKVDNSESERIQLIDWTTDRLIYVKITSGPSALTPGRQRIISYDSKQDSQIELASANYFNDVEVIKNSVYYAPTGESKLIKVGADGTAATTLIEKETWALIRSVYDKLLANTSGNLWYEQSLTSGKISQLSGTPANTTNRIYIDSPDGSKSAWIDNRDGKGVLVITDTKALTDKVYQSKGGLGFPVRWLSNKHLLYRVSNAQETADYIINIEGGEPKKVGDVTSTGGTSRWYYYL